MSDDYSWDDAMVVSDKPVDNTRCPVCSQYKRYCDGHE